MPLKNTPERFGAIAKTFHWVLAILVLMVLMIGYQMEKLEGEERIFVIFYHKSWGVLVLILMSLRLMWRFVSPRPGRLATVKPWEDSLASLVHFMLYAAVLAMPITGWIMSSAGEYPVSFFGLFTLPQIVPKNPELMQAARSSHGIIAMMILGLLFLHFSGAAKHHVIDRDNTLRRMAWDKMGFAGGIVLLAVGALLYALPLSGFISNELNEEEKVAVVKESIVSQPLPSEQVEAKANVWAVDPAESVIKFKATQSGQVFEGEFKNFTANIEFDAATATGKVDVRIPIANFASGSSERDTEVQKAEWFDAAQFPEAQFTADSFTHGEGNSYTAHGTLNIRGVQKAVDLPFTFVPSTADGVETAQVVGSMSVNRLDYGVGQGAWQKTDMVADSVGIYVYVKARRPVHVSGPGVSE